MAVDFLTIASGFNVTSAYFIARSDLPISIVFPASMALAEYRLQGAISSGASASGDKFGDIQLQYQPAGANYGPFTVISFGNNTAQVFVGPVGPLPTPFIRIFSVSSQTLTTTLTLMTARYSS